MARGLLFELRALLLSAASFALLCSRPPIKVSMVLIITGSRVVIDGIAIDTRYFTALTPPGHVIGLAYGLTVLGLGIAKGIRTGMALKTATAMT